MNTLKSKARCPKCGCTNLLLTEISIVSTTFIQSVGYVDKDSSYNEVGNIIRLEGKCNRCNHCWIFRNAIQITGVLEHPRNFNQYKESMNIEEAARESSIKAGYNPNIAADAVGQAVYEAAYKAGANEMRKHSILVYRSLCPSYKVQSRYECGNYSHRMEWKTKVCDMNCQYMKNLMERL